MVKTWPQCYGDKYILVNLEHFSQNHASFPFLIELMGDKAMTNFDYYFAQPIPSDEIELPWNNFVLQTTLEPLL
jgi:hypothetical protein